MGSHLHSRKNDQIGNLPLCLSYRLKVSPNTIIANTQTDSFVDPFKADSIKRPNPLGHAGQEGIGKNQHVNVPFLSETCQLQDLMLAVAKSGMDMDGCGVLF